MSDTTSPVHIYVCHHKPGPSFTDGCFLPIQVGAEQASVDLGTLRDDTGDHISAKNKTFCELTALYWAWKNDTDAKWIGLMHYRRLLDFTGAHHTTDAHGCVNYDVLDDATIHALGLTEEAVTAVVESKPGLLAVLPEKWSVRNAGSRSLHSHYVSADHHFGKDLDVLRDVIGALYPSDVKQYDEVMRGHDGYFTNIFVLRRDVFDEYCTWLFAILFEVERRLDLTNYSVAARRVFGYMSERLFNVFAHRKFASAETYVELERVFVKDQKPPYRAPNLLEGEVVSIVTASDGNFVPHLAAFMASVQDNLAVGKQLDLIVLDGGIPAEQRGLLQRQFRDSGPGRLTFVACVELFSDIPVHAHFSAATFYRLSLGELLANHDRVVYVDADTIVLDDLSTLYDMDMEGNAAAAVPDVIMRSFAATGVPAMKEAGGARAGDYLRNWLGMGDHGDDYFQAGLIVIDLQRFREMNIRDKAYQDLISKRYWFLDQDVLNRHLVGQVKFLDLGWNVVNVSMDVISGLTSNLATKVREVFSAPKMVHYAGFEAKPWNNAAAPLAHFYWYYLRKTFWYEAVIERRPLSAPTLDAGLRRGPMYRGARALWRRLPNRLQRQLFWVRDLMM
ncbi:hypothetical protein GQ57_32160 [Burkholderia sp. MSh2]|uniref:General stress protein A n=1 Tax=Burkholderia paludis TaxID=1506587 RepID=A0A6J5DW12_9BURK|nr:MULTISPECIES: DUF4422 domain-containing protein [Burkholderia]KEZ01971.1 hypothetical protein GQ57_32160 [Burkholderia sp. MSh2]KFG93159.1 hypothetical protein GQ56_0133210 [Burkholderia paludis]CAB3758218.1 hypothetical protein LMG30113_03137 [Burkholderia paludis]VWB99214.1 General stress protein A [Burkholderia paludis]